MLGYVPEFSENILIFLKNISPVAGDEVAVAEEQYETHYACEDSQLNITCEAALHLNIIRANYGRFSIAICNTHGNTDWSVNCMSPRTLRVIRARLINR